MVPGGREATARFAGLDRGEAQSTHPELTFIADHVFIPNRAALIPPTRCPAKTARATEALSDDQSAAEEGHHCDRVLSSEDRLMVFHVKHETRTKSPARVASRSSRPEIKRAGQPPPLIAPNRPTDGCSEPGETDIPQQEPGEEQ